MKQTQHQMELQARRRALVPYRVFNDMQRSGNPVTAEELRVLAEKRPELWGRFLPAWAPKG